MNTLLKRIGRYFCNSTELIEKAKTKISKFQLKNYSDSVKLRVSGGKGGNGTISFFTDKRVRRGAPYGGDGGNGGNIVIQAHSSMHDLSHLRLKTIEGVDGQNGGSNGRMGKNGGKTLLRVPTGTFVYELQILQDKETKHLIADLSKDKQDCIVARGGQAGKGNKMHPGIMDQQRFGIEGESKTIYLELKTLADIGLVGFPNIGKSTFLAATTRALPKIANYQFTTLKPSVGRVKFVDDYWMSIADIPGIIEGAHTNKGLGFQFLRHIQRTRILIFMLDITHKDPLQEYRILEKELQEYKGNILKDKKRIVVFNKEDCLEDSELKFQLFADKIASKSFLISAKEGKGVGEVLVELRRLKEEIVEKERIEEELMMMQRGNKERIQL